MNTTIFVSILEIVLKYKSLFLIVYNFYFITFFHIFPGHIVRNLAKNLNPSQKKGMTKCTQNHKLTNFSVKLCFTNYFVERGNVGGEHERGDDNLCPKFVNFRSKLLRSCITSRHTHYWLVCFTGSLNQFYTIWSTKLGGLSLLSRLREAITNKKTA